MTVALTASLFDLPAVAACGGAEPPFYNLTVQPMVISANGAVSINLTIAEAKSSTATYAFTVILPDSTKVMASADVTLGSRGDGYRSLTYPTDFGAEASTGKQGIYVVYASSPSEPDVRLASSSFEVG